MVIQNNIESIFQSNYNVLNHRLHQKYNFDILWNKYKYYLPNLMKYFGFIDKDQVTHTNCP